MMDNKKAKLRVMIDVETLGVKPGDVVTEVGIVVVDEGWNEVTSVSSFLDVSDSLLKGLRVDESTMEWRQAQGCMHFSGGGDKLVDYCVGLNGFVEGLKKLEGGVCELEFWSWGAFDQGMLDGVYAAVGVDVPWHYAEWRDARTVCKLAGVLREGDVEHDGLADCYQQVDALRRAFDVLGLNSNLEMEGVA